MPFACELNRNGACLAVFDCRCTDEAYPGCAGGCCIADVCQKKFSTTFKANRPTTFFS